MEAIYEQHGFYPHSNEEASKVIALMGHTDHQLPTLQYLDVVARHQYNHHADASRSVRAIVHSFAEYAGNAANEEYYMEQFIGQLSAMQSGKLSSFADIFELNDLKHDYNLVAAFTAMTRHLEMNEYVTTSEDDRLGKRYLVDLTDGPERLTRISETLGGHSAIRLEQTAQTVQREENRRFDYWRNHLEASKRHLFAREVAARALHELGEVV